MDVRRTIDPPRRLFGRRGFLTGAGATLVYAALAPAAWPRFAGAQNIGGYPFTLGIASGDPTADQVVVLVHQVLTKRILPPGPDPA